MSALTSFTNCTRSKPSLVPVENVPHISLLHTTPTKVDQLLLRQLQYFSVVLNQLGLLILTEASAVDV
jgi:hypothetical protein